MKIEMHMHTSQVSVCGHVSAEEGVGIYKKLGYDTLVITDHFNPYLFNYAKEVTGNDYTADFSLSGYRAAKEAGEKLGMNILLGCEICLRGESNDYLLYGITEDFFNHPEYMDMNVSSLSHFCTENGILLYQAHPMRNRMTIVKPGYLYGIEVHNGNPRHDSRNDIADIWADKYNMRKISGSDFHQIDDAGTGGIVTNESVCCMTDLKKVLESGNYSLITGKE